MTKFIARRVVRGLVALILFQSLLFAMIQAIPYDFSVFVGVGQSGRAQVQQALGLDRPLWEQYTTWLGNFFKGDLGRSFTAWPTPVTELVLNRAARTLLLFLSAAVLSYLLGIWLGKMIAWRRGGAFEIGITIGGVASYTSFAPWLGFVVLNIFGWKLGWFSYQNIVDSNVWFRAPVSIEAILARMFLTAVLVSGSLYTLWRFTQGMKDVRWRWRIRGAGTLLTGVGVAIWWFQSGFSLLALDVLDHLVLPMGTVVLLSFGETMLLMRTSMLEVVTNDYVLTARAKGLPDRVVRDQHVARNAILPVLTRLLLNLPFVLIGSLAIELVFNWDAIGQIIFTAIEYHDIPVLMGILSMVGVIALVAHIVLDILYVYLDPRLRYAEGR